MRIILLGAPGVGKGTQGKKIANYFAVQKLSTGEMLRNEVNNDTDLGKIVADILKKGLLVSDDIIEEVVVSILSNDSYENGFILDGFPRTFHQAKFLSEILSKFDDEYFIININMDKKKIIERIINRVTCKDCGHSFINVLTIGDALICPNCDSENCYIREDDNIDSINKRLEIYDQLTRPMIDYYRKFKNWIEIDGDDTVDAVFDSIIYAINYRIGDSCNIYKD